MAESNVANYTDDTILYMLYMCVEKIMMCKENWNLNL